MTKPPSRQNPHLERKHNGLHIQIPKIKYLSLDISFLNTRNQTGYSHSGSECKMSTFRLVAMSQSLKAESHSI